VVDRVSFEELMSVPEFRQLARSGGAALMTTHVGSGNRESSSYLTIGAGAVTDGEADSRCSGLMGTVAASRGVVVTQVGAADAVGIDSRPGALVLGSIGCGMAGPGSFGGPAEVPDATFPGGIRTDGGPIVSTVASLGDPGLAAVDLADTLRIDREAPSSYPPVTDRYRREALLQAGRIVRQAVEASTASRVLVLVATPQPSFEMDRVGDEVTPLVMAEGSPGAIFRANGPLHALRSAGTRETGLVSNVDVAPTILSFFGLPIPLEMDGQPVVSTGADAPFALHDRELEQRRTRVPLQSGELAFVSLLFVFAWVAMFRMGIRGSLSEPIRRLGRFLTLAGAAFPTVLLAGGLLPRFTYAWELPFLVLSTAGLAWLAGRSRLPGPLGPFVFLGLVGLAFLLVDGAVGGRSFRMPLLGGTMFDGVRFYGLPNSMFMVPLASALFVSHRLSDRAGFALLVGTALFVGFPALGADIGGAIALFVAAGLWWSLRTRGRLGVRELAVAVGVAVLGLAVVLSANRLFPGAPTHATRFVARSGGRLATALDEARRRLGVGVRQLLGHPAAFIPILGLPAVAALAVRPPRPIRAGMELDPMWRDVLIAMSLAGLVAFFVNDTGVAAAAPVFLPAGCALVYPAFRAVRVAPAGPARTEEAAAR
jgi:hypothetical protein